MLERIGLVVFISFCILMVYFHNESEVEIYECAKPQSTPYFVGTAHNFKVLKGKVLYIEEGECLSQKMKRGDWFEMKNALKNVKGL